MLHDTDTPIDLMLRGFDQTQVLAQTGVDIGYNGRALRDDARGTDRFAYKAEHVRKRVTSSQVFAALQLYASGGSKTEVLGALGLAGENTVTLRALFTEIGLATQFKAADSAARRTSMVAGMVSKHGVANPFELAEVQEQAAQTRLERYGASYTLAAGSTLADGARETFAEHMADETFAADVVARRAATNVERLGVDVPAKSPVVQAKMRATSQERYGVEHPAQRPEARAAQSAHVLVTGKVRAMKARATSMERYGVEHVSQTAEARAAQSVRMLDPENQRRATAVKRVNGTFNASSSEETLYLLLVEHFGADDVLRQYRDDDRYPYLCDFYVPSRDLFVELNGMWTHGGHWYDPASEADTKQVARWAAKGTKFYDAAIEQWCTRDVTKRESARAAGLNLVVLWDAKGLDDARLWLAMGAPDGVDWGRMYSWLPGRDLVLTGQHGALSDGVRSATWEARVATWREFYSRELALWSANPPARAWGTVQGRLYANRYRYLDKTPDELTDFEILRGLSISGQIRGWTVFDNTGMKHVLDTRDVTSIYDPCAGWGERLVTAAARGITYLGVDINRAVVAGHRKIVATHGLTEQRTIYGDAAKIDQRHGKHGLVFTCPPYGDIEIYTSRGAENLDEAGFLAWWAQVVEHSVSPSTRVFAYQINQRWKDRMNQVLTDAGWRLDEQVAVGKGRASHLNRTRGATSKSEYEEVQVFVRA